MIRTVAPLALLTLLIACKAPTTPQEPALGFPRGAVRAALDQPTAVATERLKGIYPKARVVPGPLHRIVTSDEQVEELILFQDMRSARVNSVVVKFSERLTETERRAILKTTGVDELAQLKAGEVQESAHEGLLWRARWGDRQGRLTVTVEAPREVSPAPRAR